MKNINWKLVTATLIVFVYVSPVFAHSTPEGNRAELNGSTCTIGSSFELA